MLTRPAVSIIIPARNEQDCIGGTLLAIHQRVSLNYEVIVINDHSTDHTAQIVQGYMNQTRLIDNLGKPGFAHALRLGYMDAWGKVIVTMMADLCDDPDTIQAMYACIEQGHDVVCGSRYMKGGQKIGIDSPIKDKLSRFVGWTLCRWDGLPTCDAPNAFKMYRRDLLQSIPIESKGFACSLEIILKAYQRGAKITEVPTTWRKRTTGQSKFRLRKCREYVRWFLWGLCLRRGTTRADGVPPSH